MRIHSTLKTLTIIKKVSLSTLFATILLLTGCFITSCSQKAANNKIPIEIKVIQKESSKEESLPPPTTPRTVKEWLELHGYKIEIDSSGIRIEGSHNTGEGISFTGEGDGSYRLTVSGIGTAILKSDAAGNLIIEE